VVEVFLVDDVVDVYEIVVFGWDFDG